MKRKQMGRKGGVALLTVLGIVFALCLVLGTMVVVGNQRVYTARKLANRTMAITIAEAGAAQAYTVLSTNFDLCTNAAAFPLTAYGGGTYDVGVMCVSSNRATICSTGTYGNVSEYVMLDVVNNLDSTARGGRGGSRSSASAYGFAIVAGGDMRWDGNAGMELSNGWMHANGSYRANGINLVTGNVESCVQIEHIGGATITGTGQAPVITGGGIGTPIITGVPLVTIPDIDLSPYYLCASNNAQVFTGPKTLSGTVTPPGGVMWVNGDLNFGNGTYTGCFIATGDMELKTTGEGTITCAKVNSYPLLVARDGNIVIKQAKTFTFRGLIYCKTGYFDKQGNGDVFGIGTIITAGNASKNGGWSGMIYEDSTPVPPGGRGGAPGGGSFTGVVEVEAWQR